MSKAVMSELIAKAMRAHVIFYSVSFVCNGWLEEEAFTVRNSNLAEAFIQLVERYPDADLTKLDIHCEL